SLPPALQEVPLPGGGWAPGGFQSTLGTLLFLAKAGSAYQGADCRIVGARAVPDYLTWGDPELGTGTMSREWRGGSDSGGRFRKRTWKTWMFGFPFPKSGVISMLEQGKLWIPDLDSKEKEDPRGSHTGDRRVHADLLPSKRERRNWMEQDHWGFEDEKVAGVHWGYEETRTLLAILSQTELYEALRNCHRNSQVYGAVAERLREYGFLRTLEQCRTKFKGLQKSYRKVKSGHPPETCPFFEEMEALMSAQVIALPSNGLEEAASHSGQVGSDAEPEEPQQGGWQHEEEAEEAQAEESDSDEMDLEATSQDPDKSAAHVMFRSPSGVHWGYEETKTYLAILSETQFYEALQNCHRNSQLYGAVAERLWDYGFFRTPEQCRTKFKSLQTSYRKVKNGQARETCPFFEEMDALVSAQVAAPSSDGKKEETACPIQGTSDAETEKQAADTEEAIEEDSEDNEEDIEIPPGAVLTRAPVLFQSPSALVDDVDAEYNFTNTTPPHNTTFLQPMDHQVICSFKKLNTNVLFIGCGGGDCVHGQKMGLEVDGADTEELVENHEEELMTEELAELQSEQQKALVEEHSTKEEEDREEVRSD
ncbi:zinc finger and SCAN domain-containing protein 29, partial [Erethizon dorsatum]